MSFFTKSFAPRVQGLFSKGVGGARSFFTKGQGALSQLSRGLATGSRLLGEGARKVDTIAGDPAVQGLASKVGLAGALGQARMGAKALETGSRALGEGSKFVAPETYSGQSPAQVATNILEKASPVAKSLRMRFA